jgi:hypothetical protein
MAHTTTIAALIDDLRPVEPTAARPFVSFVGF